MNVHSYILSITDITNEEHAYIPSSEEGLKESSSPIDSPTNDHLLEFSSATKSPFTTSQDTSNWEKVRQEVTCAICLELLDDPKSMPCLHTYCKKCLMEALAKRPHDPDLPRDRPAINCPLCRAEVDLSDEGVEALPSNFSASRLVETVQLQDKLTENKAPKCNSCKNNDAVTSCSDCGGFFLCPSCLQVHKTLPTTMHHILISLNDYSQSTTPNATASKSPLCEKHPQELLRLFCKDCEVLVCRDCVLVKHRNHNYCFVDEIIEEERENLETVTLQELEEIFTSTTEAITEVEKMQARVLSCNETSITKLNDTFQQISVMVNERKEALLEEISQVTQDDLCPLQKQQDDLNILKEKVKNCRDFTRDTLRNGANCDVMSARKQMLERTKHLQELHEDCQLIPVTKPSTTAFYQLDAIQEQITSFGAFVDLINCSIGDVPKTIDTYKMVTIKVILKDTKGQGLCNVGDLINAQVSCCTTTNELITSTVNELGNGEYYVSFLPMVTNTHVVSIQINGEHIANSPIELSLDSGEPEETKVAEDYDCSSDILDYEAYIKLPEPDSDSDQDSDQDFHKLRPLPWHTYYHHPITTTQPSWFATTQCTVAHYPQSQTSLPKFQQHPVPKGKVNKVKGRKRYS